MDTKLAILDDAHWRDWDYKQRITTKQWRTLLLNNDDHIVFNGKIYRLEGKHLGVGVYEIYKVEC